MKYGDRGDRVVAIEYQKEGKRWMPCQVDTEGGGYGFQYCMDGLIAWDAGGGICLGTFCAAPKICAKLWWDRELWKPEKDGKVLTDDELRALGYEPIPEPLNISDYGGDHVILNPFDHNCAGNDHYEWCEQCRGFYADRSMCRHVQYQEGGSGYVLGCGATDVNLAETRESLFRLLRLLSDKAVEKIMRSAMSGKWRCSTMDSMLGGNFSMDINPNWITIYGERLGDEVDYEERYWPGFAWLMSLDKSCKEALALTAGWCWEWLRRSDHRVLSGRTYVLRPDKKRMDGWMQIDPHEASDVSEVTVRVQWPIKKVECANDCFFNKSPTEIREIAIWPRGKHDSDRSLTVTVAKAEKRGRIVGAGKRRRMLVSEVVFQLGRVVEFKGKHISEVEGYRLATC